MVTNRIILDEDRLHRPRNEHQMFDCRGNLTAHRKRGRIGNNHQRAVMEVQDSLFECPCGHRAILLAPAVVGAKMGRKTKQRILLYPIQKTIYHLGIAGAAC